MGKKELDKKTAVKIITGGRDQGKTDQEIYAGLSESYLDKKAIALLITGTPKPEDKKRYKILNTILVVVLSLGFLANLIAMIGLISRMHKSAGILVLLFPLLSLFFIYEIIKYNAAIYRFCGGFALIGAFQTLTQSKELDAVLLTGMFFSLLVAMLAFYIDAKMFPDYKPRNLKQNGNGDYNF
ncbi:hypothetical protein FNO01nite_20930 [Flavobacterium noncentrifugens]|uniref:Uncharacterized protein n=1 Tax=Flavobacterium noncentrifugens TaxID=1128970 RepID=A0A1G8YZX3_9FLAO|nr:hypothetical protein [Flavobacterium noncentrifugens]GEP51421.1 hypothetical protein FNO01nite_20930 [Flavobacterium noncentrifugens]SDK08331.1 hypothetical protein SAMN04487935_2543 [Flavobacterium noncentrifugens]